MKHIKATLKNSEDWSRRFVDESDYDTLLTDTTTVNYSGKPLIVFLKNVIPYEMNLNAIGAANTMGLSTNNRGTATGIKAKYKIREDGVKSKTLRVQTGWAVNSGIVGNFEREVRRPFCHPTAWTERHKAIYDSHIVPLAEHVSNLFFAHCQFGWSFQKEIADRTHKDWLIGNSVFTTITVNKNFRTACHKDAGDLPGGRSCMTVMEYGPYKGAHLVLPSFRIGVDIRMGDMIIFDPHQFHGNTQIVPLHPKAARYSMVFYYREMIQYCQSKKEELNYAKNRKPGDRLFPEAD